MAEYLVDGYATRQWSSRPVTNLDPGVAVAGIYLYEAGKYRGYAYFFPDGTSLGPPVHDAANGRVFIHLNLSQYTATVDTLRYEKPIYVYYNSATDAAIRTGAEPTGEEE